MRKIDADERIKIMLQKVNRLPATTKTPNNIILVTTDDVVEIFRELSPYTMSRLDGVELLNDQLHNAKLLAEKVLDI